MKVKMYKNEEKRKINFTKNYWFKVLSIDIYSYEEFKLNNMSTYSEELIEMINVLSNMKEIIKEKNKGLVIFLKEFRRYLNKNNFFNVYYPRDVELIKSRLTRIIRCSNESNIKKDLLLLKDSLKGFRENKNLIINSMFNNLTHCIYEKSKLEYSMNRLKNIINDLVVELLIEGYTLEFLKKRVYQESTYEFYKEKMLFKKLSLREQFQQKVEIFTREQRSLDTIVVFRINNLKTLTPYKVDELLFYNPLKSDMLQGKFKQKVFTEESGLLKKEEWDVFQKDLKMNSDLNSDINQLIKYTDVHCRIKLKKVKMNLAKDIARRKVEEVIGTLRYIYNLDHISVSDEYVIKVGARSQSPLFPINHNDKYLKGSYRGFELHRNLKEDLQNSKSSINQITKSLDMKKDVLIKGLRTLHLGEDENLKINKYLHFWIALEYLVGIEKNGNIKNSILNKCSFTLVRNYFKLELYSIYNELRRQFFSDTGKVTLSSTQIPDEISNVPGMEEFMDRVDIKVFARSLPIFIKYCNNELLKNQIENFINIYENKNARFKVADELVNNYKSLLSKLYRIRNKIVHSALVDEIELEIYCNWLHSILIALCKDLIEQIVDKKDVTKSYYSWKNEVLSNRESIFR
jgi:hypothetical protein